MKLPKLGDLRRDPAQWYVYEHPEDQPLFVVGPPGSGKTSLAVHRARFLANLGQRVVILTRTRMLVALAKQLAGSPSVSVETMHALVPSDCGRYFSGGLPRLGKYEYDWEAIVSQLASCGARPPRRHLIVDEGQNLPPSFFRWARAYGAEVLTVFADEHQATSPQTSTLENIAQNASLSSPKRLPTNHRNTREISALAEHFQRSARIPAAVIARSNGGDSPRLLGCQSWDALAKQVERRYLARRESIGVIVRKKDEVHDLVQRLRQKLDTDHRIDSYTSDTDRGEEASIMLLEPGITVLTSESAIGLEFETVYLTDLARSLPGADPMDFRRMYMLCARARDMLFLVDGLPQLDPEQLAALPDESLLER